MGREVKTSEGTAAPAARHAHLSVYSAVPVEMQNVLRWLLGGVNDNLIQHRAENAFFERRWGRRMLPHGAKVLAHME